MPEEDRITRAVRCDACMDAWRPSPHSAQPIEAFPWWRVGLSKDRALRPLYRSACNGTFAVRGSSQPGAFVLTMMIACMTDSTSDWR